jgi:hypothetical protein
MSAPDDLARFVEPISRAVRDGDPQLVLDLFRPRRPRRGPTFSSCCWSARRARPGRSCCQRRPRSRPGR